MVFRRADGGVAPLSPGDVRKALDTILQSESFSNSDRCSRFLRYIVERSLSGDAAGLKEYAIGLEVFGKPSSFDPRTDTIVRVQARRLRKRLENYYANVRAASPIVIELPKGHYEPTFRANHPKGALTAFARRRRSQLWLVLGACVIPIGVLLLGGIEMIDVSVSSWWEAETVAPAKAKGESAPLSVPLTSFGGHESQPDLSPDGEKVAFVWDGEAQNNYEIYVKSISGDTLDRLTHDPAPECCPVWSPDGRRIAFLRPSRAGADLVVLSLSERKEKLLARLSRLGHQLSWSPNGKYLAVEDRPDGEPQGIFLVASDSGSRDRVTASPNGFTDIWPAFSPDGRALAFARGNRDFAVYMLELGNDGAPATAPQPLTTHSYLLGGLDWTPDGRQLTFGLYTEEVGWRLWQVGVEAQGKAPVPLQVLGWQPSFARRPLSSETRLAYAAASDDKNIYRVPGPGAPQAAQHAPERIVGSSRNYTAPRLSPAADKVVFVSGQSGHGEIWTADSDGSNPQQITFSGRTDVGSPDWSPDGRMIGFGALTDGGFDVYVVESGGGVPQGRTTAPSNEGAVSWSRDGRWIYFMSDRTGPPEIYKKPATGGEAIRVTTNGGHQAIESLDGKWLYYSKSAKRPGVPESLPGEGEPGIFRIPVAGGQEQRILDEGVFGRWALSKSGIYLLRSAVGDRAPSIEQYRYDTWERTTIMTFPKDARFGIANSLTVSEDDRWIVYAMYDHTASDLMLVENY